MKTVNLNIDKFLGLHSDALGDTELKIGELSSMQNFKVTKNYNLEKRTGYASQLTTATTVPIHGQWYGTLNGSLTHLFASNGHIYQNLGTGLTTDLGTLTDARTNFFQFEDTQGIVQREAGTSTRFGYNATEQYLGQTITPTRNTKLTSAIFSLRRSDFNMPAADCSCKLYATAAGIPTTLIATASNVVSSSTLAYAANYFTTCPFYFDSVQLTANTMYAFVLSRSNANSTTYYFSAASTTTGATYSGGTVVSGTSVPAWTIVDDDLWFKISVKPEYSIYIQNGTEYKKWTGYGSIADVSGYVPIIQTGTIPTTGVGVISENLNSLNGQRKVLFNGDGATKIYVLPEKNISSVNNVYVNDIGASSYTTDLSLGTVTFTTAPNTAIDNVEIIYTIGSGQRTDITRRTDVELYGGKNDSRVFIYGNDATLSYTGLADGVPSAEYFPTLNYVRVGSNEFNITSLVKQYDRLIIFKQDNTWWTNYEYDTTLGVNFPMYPLNDSIGSSVIGSGKLIQNNPFVIFNNQIYQFVASNVRDERNATLMSLRVQPLLDAETMTSAITFDNESDGELWIIIAKECYIYNYFLDVWYYYLFNDTVTSIIKTDKLTIGTSGGQLMKFGTELTDNGTAIPAIMKTGYINYGTIIFRKFVNFIWLQLYLDGTASKADFYYQTDKDAETLVKSLAYTTETNPKAIRLKPKMKKFVVGKFIIKNDSTTQKCRILGISAPAIIGGISK